MNAGVSIILSIVFVCCAITGSTAQTQPEMYVQIQLHKGGAVFGNIIESNQSTVTVATIWDRNMVIFRDDIAEIIQTQKSKRALFEENLVTIIDKKSSTFTGHVLSANADSLEFRTTGGIRLMIPQDKIQRLFTGESIAVSGAQPVIMFPEEEHGYWSNDRMYIFPTGFIMEQGEVYASLHYIIFPSISIGLHKYFSFLGGISLIPFDDGQYYILNPKVGFYQTENVGIAMSFTMLGALGGNRYRSPENYQFIQAVASGTSGKITGTFGIGWGFDDGNTSDQPAFSFGLDAELSRSVHFIAEGFVFGNRNSDLLLMFGFRFNGRTVSGDLALWTNPEQARKSYNTTYLYPYFALYFHF